MLSIGSEKFDYMRDPLDFCLYPTDIISRFVGQYIIVYATDGEGDKFVEAFKNFFVDVEYVANLKYTAGRFVCDPPITIRKKVIKDLDQLVAMRRGEPIIVQSHKRWVELVANLESKGLELGKDIFFWEQGYPRTKLISKFIEHNEKIWKSEKITSDRRILIPFQAVSYWMEAARNVQCAYFGNYLAHKYNAEINCYLRGYKQERILMYGYKTSRDIAHSFNANGIFNCACNEEQIKRARELFDQIMAKVNTWKDLLSVEINGINFGVSIIRDYCRHNLPRLDLKASPNFKNVLLTVTQRIVFLIDYFNEHDDIKAIVLWDGVCREGYMRDIAIHKGIPTYAVYYFGRAEKLEMNYPSDSHFAYYKEFFNQLSPREQELGLEWARRSLEARLSGDTKDIKYMKTSIYSVEVGDRVLEQNDKIKLLICPHILDDDIHCGWQVFGCFMEWLIHLGELSNQPDYDWYLKPHPKAGERDMNLYAELTERYPRIKLIPAMTSPKQLKAEGVKFAFTIFGTLGHEYPALGIQVINAGNNPHVAFNFCHNPKTPEEFDDIISKLPELADREVDMQEIYQFYCIHFLYYKRMSRPIRYALFKRPDMYPSPRPRPGIFPPGVAAKHRTYLEEWTPDFHEITKRKVAELFQEMDSRQADVLYKNDEAVIQAKLEAVGMTLD